MNENCSLDRTHSAWPDLSCIRAEWFFALYSNGAHAFRNGWPVHRRTLPVALRVRCECAPSRGWRASVGEPLRAAGACASWPGDREHLFLSSAHGAQWPAAGDRCRNFVGNHSPSLPPILLWHLCAKGGVGGPVPAALEHLQV